MKYLYEMKWEKQNSFERICWGMHRHKEGKPCSVWQWITPWCQQMNTLSQLYTEAEEKGGKRESGRIKRRGGTQICRWGEDKTGNQTINVAPSVKQIQADVSEMLLVSSWIYHCVKLIIPPTYICMPAKDCWWSGAQSSSLLSVHIKRLTSA